MARRTRQFADLYECAGVGRGDVVFVILPHHEDLMPAFLGATWLGAIPAFLPAMTAKLDPERYYENLRALLASTYPAAILTFDELRDAIVPIIRDEFPQVSVLVHGDVREDDLHPEPAAHGPEDVALLQYSSGSTGRQKGAALSHRAVLAEIRGVGEFFDLTDRDSFATWVPLYHDWGLVCIALHALELGTHYTLMSPMHWVTDPAAMLRAITEYRPTYYCQPNFAFSFMARRVSDENLDSIDLSSLRICSNGAEPCFFEDHETFARRFELCGFRREALAIVYGMAEVTNSVFASGPKEPIMVDRIDRVILQDEGRAEPVDEDHPNLMCVLGVGRALTDTTFRIVDDDGRELPERNNGEIEIRSRAAYHGYYRNPEATEKADHDGWYVTGDLGYRVGDTLFVTGRKSDVVILGGTNIYPQDVERIVSDHPAVVSGRVAAIGVDDRERGTQRLELIVESRSVDEQTLVDIVAHARREVALELGVQVDGIHHAPYGWLIKTSSGKIARLPNYERLPELKGRETEWRTTDVADVGR